MGLVQTFSGRVQPLVADCRWTDSRLVWLSAPTRRGQLLPTRPFSGRWRCPLQGCRARILALKRAPARYLVELGLMVCNQGPGTRSSWPQECPWHRLLVDALYAAGDPSCSPCPSGQCSCYGERRCGAASPGDRQLGVLRGARKWRSRSLRSAACTCRAPACPPSV